MLIHMECNKYLKVLKLFYEIILNTGRLPIKLNLSVITPIPKTKEIPNDASCFRPISVSSVFANIYEAIILNKVSSVCNTHPNQFGYKKNSSCKHAFFVLNETIRYYNSRRSNVYIISLDAQKAFDSLWRNGLFYKLMRKIPDIFWRGIVNYYNSSTVKIKHEGTTSESFEINGGVKQGGILSPYLFNFFIDELVVSCCQKDIGCKLGKINTSILAYCDDICLLSPTMFQLKVLLNMCQEFGDNWKMVFNPSKSHVTIMRHNKDKSNKKQKILLNGRQLRHESNFIYLGLPVGDWQYIQQYWDTKFNKVIRSFYSLNILGLKKQHDVSFYDC